MSKISIRSVGILLLLVAMLNVYGVTVNTDGTDVEVPFATTATEYELSASPPSGWYFTEEFNHPSSNGWYVPESTSYTVRYEKLDNVTTVFVDAASTFSATISGKMYKPGGTGDPLRWGVHGSGSATLSYSISPSSANIAYGNNEDFYYKLNGNNAPGGMWKYSPDGGNYSGDSAKYTFPPSSSNLEANAYQVYAARNSAGEREKFVPVRYVGVDKIQASIAGGTYADTATNLYVIPDSSLYLKALPKPSGDWPDGNPDWSCSGSWIFASHFIGDSDDVDTVQMNTSEMGDEFTVTVACGDSEKSVTVNVVEVKLKSVNFTHGHTLKKQDADTWTNDYYLSSGDETIAMEWEDTDLDGTPETNEPACYTKGTSPKMTVTVSASHSLSASTPVTFRVKKGATTYATTGSVNFSGTEASKSDITWGTALPGNVKNTDYTLSWAVSGDGGTTYHDIGSNTTKFFVSYGNPSGTSATAKRLNWCTLQANGQSDDEDCADKLWDGVASGTTFSRSGTQTGWRLLDGGTGDCDNQATCMINTVEMLGFSGSLKKVRASTNSGAGNCLDFETRTVGDDTQHLILDFETSGNDHDWNQYEGCCNTASNYYAITPKLKASNDYTMLQAISCRQYWVKLVVDQYGSWSVDSFDGPVAKP